MVKWSLVAFLAVVTTTARADPPPQAPPAPVTRVELPGGIALSIDDYRLNARRGATTAQLGGPPFQSGSMWKSIDKVTVKDGQVTLAVTDLCSEGEAKFSLHAVEARLENVAALVLHHAKKYADAAAGFAKAVALDPDYELAALNLASALVEQGKTSEAVAALASRLASNPAGTYVRILDDPELAPLLAAPEVLAVRAKIAGTATAATIKQLAFSPDRGLIAAKIDEGCGYSDAGRSYIEIRSTTDQLATRLPIVDCMDILGSGTGKIDAAGKRRVVQNKAKIDRVFADLGFVAAEDLTKRPRPSSAAKLREPVSAGVDDQNVSLRVGKHVVASRPFAGQHVDWEAYLPAANAMVVAWDVTQPEAECGARPPYTGIQVLAVP